MVPEAFPNGLPREVNGMSSTRDGISFVWSDGGVEMPIFSDHQITVEWWHKLYSHEWTERQFDHPDAPRVTRYVGDYENTAQEALRAARQIQNELEQEGDYVPIYVRV